MIWQIEQVSPSCPDHRGAKPRHQLSLDYPLIHLLVPRRSKNRRRWGVIEADQSVDCWWISTISGAVVPTRIRERSIQSRNEARLRNSWVISGTTETAMASAGIQDGSCSDGRSVLRGLYPWCLAYLAT